MERELHDTIVAVHVESKASPSQDINYLIVDGKAELFDIDSEYADVTLKDYSDYKVKELKIDVLNSQVTLELYK